MAKDRKSVKRGQRARAKVIAKHDTLDWSEVEDEFAIADNRDCENVDRDMMREAKRAHGEDHEDSLSGIFENAINGRRFQR